MKFSLFSLMVLFAGFTLPLTADEAPKTDGGETLYLHCFRQTKGQRVILDPDTAKDIKPSNPPARLVTVKVEAGRAFEVIYSSMHRVAGRIERDDDSYIADLEGAFGSGFKYSGRVKLDEVFDPEVTWFSGAVFRCRCVFSKEKDITPFLKAQAEADPEKLRDATERTRRNDELQGNRQAEQDGADQPATAPESKSEGVENP